MFAKLRDIILGLFRTIPARRITGTWGFSGLGEASSGPTRAIGLFIFDGKGGCSMSVDDVYHSSFNYMSPWTSVSGKYEINQDNIGDMKFKIQVDPDETVMTRFGFVVVDNDKEIRFIGLDKNLGTVSGTAKRI